MPATGRPLVSTRFSLLSPGLFAIEVPPGWRAVSFLLLSLIPNLCLMVSAGRLLSGALLGGETDLRALQRAVALDPANPDHHHRLGWILCYAAPSTQTTEGLAYLRRATVLNPHWPPYWSDVASVCESLGDRPCADMTVKRSLDTGPMKPAIHWMVANYYLRSDRLDEALDHFAKLLKMSPDYAGASFRVLSSAVKDPDIIFDRLFSLDREPALMLEYVTFLSLKGRQDAAFRVWTAVVKAHGSFDFLAAKPYLQCLIDTGRYQEAVTVWHDLARLGVVSDDSVSVPGNLIFNGSFEQAPLDAGFDWRYGEVQYVFVDFGSSGGYHGGHSLRLEFTGDRNGNYEPVFQLVPVEPSHRYRLSAYVRSEAVSSTSGPRLRVVDAARSDVLDASSQDSIGTTGWHFVEIRFSTGPETHILRVSVWRPAAVAFPVGIGGTFWVDAVSLTSASQGSMFDVQAGAN